MRVARVAVWAKQAARLFLRQHISEFSNRVINADCCPSLGRSRCATTWCACSSLVSVLNGYGSTSAIPPATRNYYKTSDPHARRWKAPSTWTWPGAWRRNPLESTFFGAPVLSERLLTQSLLARRQDYKSSSITWPCSFSHALAFSIVGALARTMFQNRGVW